jgi:hypothetical protein
MELENIILREVSQVQMAKSHMFSSYADYRPKTNEVMWTWVTH